jgi:hypothetical protein
MNTLTLDELDRINLDFNYFQPKLEKMVTFDNMVAEANFLNTLEEKLPKSDFFDLHFDMIIEGKVGQYHKALNTGKNIILEKANVPSELKAAVNEAIEDLKIYIATTINENQALALGAPSVGLDVAPHTPSKSSGIWGILKGIWDALTEGGSVIGIIQFLIDLASLIPGIGIAMDILNAIIYAVRGKWLLCAISLAAAALLGTGQWLKGAKPIARASEMIFVVLTRVGGAKTAAELVAKAGAKGGKIVEFLSKLGSILPNALAKASTILSKFIGGIGNIIGKIPGLGNLLKPIFQGIERVFVSFSDKMTLFSSNLKVLSKEGAELAVKDLEKVVSTPGATTLLTADAKVLRITTKEGKVINVPSKFVAKTGHFAMTYTKDGARILFKNSDDFVKTWKTMQSTFSKPGVNKVFGDKFRKFLVNRIFPSAFKVNFRLMIGKAIYRFIFGEPWKEGGKWTRAEVEGHGNGAFNDWIDRKISEEKKKTGAEYIPSIILDGSDRETYDRVQDYQNHFAEIMGKPTIIEAIRVKSEGDKTQEEFNKFFDDIASGKIKNDGPGDRSADLTKTDDYKEVIKQNKPRMTESRIQTVSSFSYFKKS